jgi:hypothetical protein
VHRLRHTLVSAVYSFTPARHHQLGVADSLTAHSQLKRHGNAVVGEIITISSSVLTVAAQQQLKRPGNAVIDAFV